MPEKPAGSDPTSARNGALATHARKAVMDGNTAVAHVAYRVNEVCAIFPITPSSTMAELADEWAAAGVKNIWGNVPVVQEMQSEGGAAGAVHGALQAGALTTTFTASQGLMLMIPNMFKIAGELTACVFHVAARSVAAQALSIFGDHSDVMATRTTGFALLASSSVQEAHDSALIAQAATLRSRVPFLHFFDGFRTSHELNTLTVLSDAQIRAMIDDDLVRAHRARALDPEHPFIRGTAHNPDTFFQARETVTPFYARVPAILQSAMVDLGQLTGRRYRLYEYFGAPDAERVIVMMGSGAETARETAAALGGRGEKVGVVQVRLFRPFSAADFLAALPATCRAVAVLERTKEAGAPGEPLYLDIVEALAQSFSRGQRATLPRIVGGRYGLGSKDFSPAMVKAVLDELQRTEPQNGFTVGITDDVSHTSLEVDASYSIEPSDEVRAVFYGLGADGTVGANKNTVAILAEDAGLYAQGYFVYDSHKSGAQTVSHLRFGPRPIRAPYLIGSAGFIACHQFHFLERLDVLKLAAERAIFLLNSPHGPDEIWNRLPRPVQQQLIDRRLRLFVIDASRVAREAGLDGHTNTVLQTCFFALCGVLPREEAIERIKSAIRRTYTAKGEEVVQRNFAAVDATLLRLHEVRVPREATSVIERVPAVPSGAAEAPGGAAQPGSADGVCGAAVPQFVREVTAKMLEGLGDEIPVSLLPVDGTFPSGTAVWEKRNIADQVPVWRPDLCIQCGHCGIVCPHSVIRAKYFHSSRLDGAPHDFKSAPINGRGFPDVRFSLQVYVEDCTGCGICIESCPAADPSEPAIKAINFAPKAPLVETERAHIAFFERLPVNDRTRVDFANVRGVQFLEPLFEFPGACAGCGETPYLKLLSQLFGDRMMVANATGCSSIYGANLPTTPWSRNREGRGPAWSNSLFEDAAEFGLGFRLAADKQLECARLALEAFRPRLGDALVDSTLSAPQARDSEIRAQRARVDEIKARLSALAEHEDAGHGATREDAARGSAARDLLAVVDHLVRRSIWIVGGDGWAYDIGYGGLDHVLASGRDVNVLVLDTEVYSNTGGQASKATPLGAIAKFSTAGKRVPRKDLALQAIAYGNIYVAQVAIGANAQQTLEALREAEAYPGPSLILAYSHCIAHGFDLRYGMRQQHLATASGYWPLFRFNPAMAEIGESRFRLDSPRPFVPLEDYMYNELRFRGLSFTRPAEAAALLRRAQSAVEEKYRLYEHLAELKGGAATPRTSAFHHRS